MAPPALWWRIVGGRDRERDRERWLETVYTSFLWLLCQAHSLQPLVARSCSQSGREAGRQAGRGHSTAERNGVKQEQGRKLRGRNISSLMAEHGSLIMRFLASLTFTAFLPGLRLVLTMLDLLHNN